jgi:hypothetical protein
MSNQTRSWVLMLSVPVLAACGGPDGPDELANGASGVAGQFGVMPVLRSLGRRARAFVGLVERAGVAEDLEAYNVGGTVFLPAEEDVVGYVEARPWLFEPEGQSALRDLVLGHIAHDFIPRADLTDDTIDTLLDDHPLIVTYAQESVASQSGAKASLVGDEIVEFEAIVHFVDSPLPAHGTLYDDLRESSPRFYKLCEIAYGKNLPGDVTVLVPPERDIVFALLESWPRSAFALLARRFVDRHLIDGRVTASALVGDFFKTRAGTKITAYSSGNALLVQTSDGGEAVVAARDTMRDDGIVHSITAPL